VFLKKKNLHDYINRRPDYARLYNAAYKEPEFWGVKLVPQLSKQSPPHQRQP
jgi:hypothetical protein